METPASITTPIDAVTLAIVQDAARARGMSGEDFAALAIRRVAEKEAAFNAFIQEGIDAIEEGDVYTQTEMEAWFEDRVAARRQG